MDVELILAVYQPTRSSLVSIKLFNHASQTSCAQTHRPDSIDSTSAGTISWNFFCFPSYWSD